MLSMQELSPKFGNIGDRASSLCDMLNLLVA